MQETLASLLDHLKRVAMKSDLNKMTSQNLAVVFGPVLLCPSPVNVDVDCTVDFKKHIDVLHYLLEIWPEIRGMFFLTILSLSLLKTCFTYFEIYISCIALCKKKIIASSVFSLKQACDFEPGIGVIDIYIIPT